MCFARVFLFVVAFESPKVAVFPIYFIQIEALVLVVLVFIIDSLSAVLSRQNYKNYVF